MEKQKKYEEKKTLRVLMIAFLVICVFMGIFCYYYYQQLQRTIKEESDQYLTEISKQIADNASRSINDNFAVLGTISNVLKNGKVSTYKEIQPVVSEQQHYWQYQNIFLVDKNGKAYDAYGKEVALSGEQYLQEVILERKKTMSLAQVIDGKEGVVFAIPVENMVIDGKEISALAASYDLSTFNDILAMSAFNGEAYAYIIEKDGTMILRSNSEHAAKTGYNLLSSLSTNKENEESVKKIKEGMKNTLNGIVNVTQNGVEEYLSYTALDSEQGYLVAFVPISVVSSKSQMMLRITLFFCGFITLAFAFLIGVLTLSFYSNKRKLEKIAYVDPVTGGNTIQGFYKIGEGILKDSKKGTYALVYTNIEKFKVLNEQFGKKACDEFLGDIQKGISENLQDRECMGRHFADNFCVLIRYSDEDTLVLRLKKWYENAMVQSENRKGIWISPTVEFGVFIIGDEEMPINNMIDRAKLALGENSQELERKIRYAIYDDAIRRQLFREKLLEDMMEDSLKNGEFQVYLQPKYWAVSEKISGGEALVRWQSEKEGMIYPDEFITLFEKNGFIVKLDLWVFEEVCRRITSWVKAGWAPLKVSVNCSRIHLSNPNFLEQYQEICEKHHTPPEYIEIELTENIVFEDLTYLTEIINKIHEIGFGCSMDDFGSGYSSLNMLQDIPVDTLKMDKIFFGREKVSIERTKSVVGSILSMSKALEMETVAEGVEDRFYVDMLKDLGCTYIQGYYFAKPMPISEFEVLAFGKNPENTEK